jgi:esterase/lipase superfamily enzyme
MRLLFLAAFLTLAACSDRAAASMAPDASEIARAHRQAMIDMTGSLPPNGVVGSISDGQEHPDPRRDFVLADMEFYPAPRVSRKALSRDIASEDSRFGRDVTIYVRGFKNSFSDAAFRMAQPAEDTELTGPVVSYFWPSRGNPLRYQYDTDSALFARNGLTQLRSEVQAAGAKRIVLISHSMGGRLTMEVLRQKEIQDPGWSARSLASLLLMSADIDVDVFREQVSHFARWPQPFVIFKSRNDQLLRLSARLRGER